MVHGMNAETRFWIRLAAFARLSEYVLGSGAGRDDAEELLFGKLVHGGEVKVRLKDNSPVFEITPAAPAKAGKPKGTKARRARGADQPETGEQPGETPPSPPAE